MGVLKIVERWNYTQEIIETWKQVPEIIEKYFPVKSSSQNLREIEFVDNMRVSFRNCREIWKQVPEIVEKGGFFQFSHLLYFFQYCTVQYCCSVSKEKHDQVFSAALLNGFKIQISLQLPDPDLTWRVTSTVHGLYPVLYPSSIYIMYKVLL